MRSGSECGGRIGDTCNCASAEKGEQCQFDAPYPLATGKRIGTIHHQDSARRQHGPGNGRFVCAHALVYPANVLVSRVAPIELFQITRMRSLDAICLTEYPEPERVGYAFSAPCSVTFLQRASVWPDETRL